MKLYQLIFTYIVRYSPESMRKLRYFFVKHYIKKCGTNVSVGRRAYIHKNTEIGDNSGIGFSCEINNGVSIGDNVMMGPNVIIYTQNHNIGRTDVPMREQGMDEMKPVKIEDDVWIGARVCILPGVTIGRGSICGACAVISKDVPPYSVVVGNPGKVVKTRIHSIM